MYKLHQIITSIAFTLWIFIPLNSYATVIYTWVDESGRSHFSQEPPEGVKAVRMYSEDIEPDKVGYVAPKIVAIEPSKEVIQEAEAKIIKENDSKQAESICKNATHSLKVLTTHSNLNRKDEQTGEVETLSESQRQAAIKENQQRIKLFCEDKSNK
jgi:hypothetical protein